MTGRQQAWLLMLVVWIVFIWGLILSAFTLADTGHSWLSLLCMSVAFYLIWVGMILSGRKRTKRHYTCHDNSSVTKESKP